MVGDQAPVAVHADAVQVGGHLDAATDRGYDDADIAVLTLSTTIVMGVMVDAGTARRW
jgi:hypothetical protein